jgi:hypothetical protein
MHSEGIATPTQLNNTLNQQLTIMNDQTPEAQFNEGPTAVVTGAPQADVLQVDIPESLTTPLEKKGKKTGKVVDIFKGMGNISVRPYVDANIENMGLENYGYVVYPGTSQVEQIAAIEKNGVIRYITGLDEFAPEVQLLEEEQREAIALNIRHVVHYLEKQLATNVIKVDDPVFWDKVQLLKPNNQEFWDKLTLKCDNEPAYLNPKKEPMDLLRLMAIEAGGFDLVAKSYEDAQSRAKPPKWYLDKEINTVATRTEYKKIRNHATAILEGLFGKNHKKLLYIAKVLDGNSTQYKNSTPPDVVYDNLDEYIQGNGVEGNKTRAAENFIKTSEFTMETLKLKSIVRDASFYKFIVTKPDGMIYHAKKHAVLGRNVSDVVEYLRNPLHEDVLGDLLAGVEKYWNQ